MAHSNQYRDPSQPPAQSTPPTLSIWKYPLSVTDQQTVKMPKGAEIISVADQYGVLTLWAKVDTDERQTTERVIIVMGTGGPVPEGKLDHIGTVLMGSMVWHVASKPDVCVPRSFML